MEIPFMSYGTSSLSELLPKRLMTADKEREECGWQWPKEADRLVRSKWGKEEERKG